jgi:phosphonate transport system substrate-binding protein
MRFHTFKSRAKSAALMLAAALLMPTLAEAQACPQRGELDTRFCDANKDMLADTPTDKAQQKDPSTLVFSFTPVEDPSVYENAFSDLLAHMAKVTGKRIRWYAAESYAAQVEALRSGRLHIAGVASGATPYAVNLGGFLPLVTMEKFDGTTGYTLQLLTHKDSTIKSVADLKGKKVAHVSPSSNSGDTAPRVLFSAMGIKPGTDYEVLYSGKHDNSIMGVVNKDYDAAPVASNVVTLMRDRGMFKADQVRVVYESRPFPGAAFGIAHDLTPELQAKIREAFTSFGFANSKLAKEFKEYKGFTAISYARDWGDIRAIQQATGVRYTQESLNSLKR